MSIINFEIFFQVELQEGNATIKNLSINPKMERPKVHLVHDPDIFLYKEYWNKTGNRTYLVRHYFNVNKRSEIAPWEDLIIQAENLHDCKIKWAITQLGPYNSNHPNLGNIPWEKIKDIGYKEKSNEYIECIDITDSELLDLIPSRESSRPEYINDFRNPNGNIILGVFDVHEDAHQDILSKKMVEKLIKKYGNLK